MPMMGMVMVMMVMQMVAAVMVGMVTAAVVMAWVACHEELWTGRGRAVEKPWTSPGQSACPASQTSA